MFRHIILDIVVTNPFKSSFENALTSWITFNVRLPTMHIRIPSVREYLSCFCDKRSMIGGIAKFLLDKWNSGYIDGFKPFLNLARLTLANIYSQWRLGNHFLLIYIKTIEILRLTIDFNCKWA